MTTIKFKTQNIDILFVIAALCSSIYLSFTSEFLILQIIIIISLALFYSFGKNIILSAIIIGLLTATSEHFEQYRLFITSFSIVLLAILFVKEFGIDFKSYLKFPRIIKIFFLLLFFTLLLSTINSNYLVTSITASIRMFVFLFIAYMFFSFLKDEMNIWIYIYSLIAVLLVIGTLMIVDLLHLGIQNYFQRIFLTSLFNLQGSLTYTGYTIFFITISLITSMFFLERFNSNTYKLILACLFIFNVIILLFANSRGGIAASVISILFILLVLNRTLLLKSIIAITVIMLVLFLSSQEINDAVNSYLRLETVSDREVYWQSGIDVVKDYPIFGLGADTFDKHFFSYSPSNILGYYSPDMAIQGKPHPHNFFLYFTAENGILGLITSISFFILFFFIATKTVKAYKQTNREYFILSIAITGIGLGILLRSFIEVTGYLIYGYITRDLPFWLVFVVLIYLYQKSHHNFELKK